MPGELCHTRYNKLYVEHLPGDLALTKRPLVITCDDHSYGRNKRCRTNVIKTAPTVLRVPEIAELWELGDVRSTPKDFKGTIHVLGFKFPRGGHNFSRRMVLNKVFKGGRLCSLNKALGRGDGTFFQGHKVSLSLLPKFGLCCHHLLVLDNGQLDPSNLLDPFGQHENLTWILSVDVELRGNL